MSNISLNVNSDYEECLPIHYFFQVTVALKEIIILREVLGGLAAANLVQICHKYVFGEIVYLTQISTDTLKVDIL